MHVSMLRACACVYVSVVGGFRRNEKDFEFFLAAKFEDFLLYRR